MRSAERNERGDVLKPSRLRQDFGAAGKALCGMEELKAQSRRLRMAFFRVFMFFVLS